MSITAAEDILIVDNYLHVTGTQASVNNTTGALVVAGGVGMNENLNIGSDTVVDGTTNLVGTLTIGTGATNYYFPTESNGIGDQVLVYSTSGALVFTSLQDATSVNIAVPPTFGSCNLLKSQGTGKDVETTNVVVSSEDDLSGVNSIDVLSNSTFGGNLLITSTVSSTNATSGALVVAGGVGIGENLNVGGDLVVEGLTCLEGELKIGSGTTSYTFPTEAGTDNQIMVLNTSGALVMEDQVNTADNVEAPTPFGTDNRLIRTLGTDRDVESTGVTMTDNGDILGINTLNVNNSSTIGGTLYLTSTTSSTDTSTGALVVSGGVGISENLNVGGSTNLDGTVRLTSTVESNDSTSGALVVNGGVGVGGNVNVDGTLTADSFDFGDGDIVIDSTTASTSATSGALVVAGGTGISGDVNIGGDTNVGGTLTTTSLNTTNTTSSTSNTTGAVVISGGMGLGENLNMGGVLNVNNTTSSTSPDTGAFVTDGGMGVAENVNVGNEINTDGTFNVDNTANSTGTGTGALVVDGGASITKDLYLGGSLFIDQPIVNNSKFFNAYHTSTFSVASTTFVAIPWDVEIRKDTGLYTHGAGSADIDVVEAGWYKIVTEITSQIEAGDGSNRTIGSARITINGTPVGETASFMYNRTAQRGHYTTNITIIQNLAASDTINVEINRLLGTSTITTVTEANRITVSRI